jgi:hypothetical protein
MGLLRATVAEVGIARLLMPFAQLCSSYSRLKIGATLQLAKIKKPGSLATRMNYDSHLVLEKGTTGFLFSYLKGQTKKPPRFNFAMQFSRNTFQQKCGAHTLQTKKYRLGQIC